MSVAPYRFSVREEREECHNNSNVTVRRLDEVMAVVRRRIAEKEGEDDFYNYVLLWNILYDIKTELIAKGVVSPMSSYILPGSIYIAKALVDGVMDVDAAASVIGSVRRRVKKFIRTLAYDKNLELLIPENVGISSLKIFAWVDYVGKSREGNELYVLTLYFSFPFDIHKGDGRSEYEPVSFLFEKKGDRYVPIRVFARVHYSIYAYDIENMDKVRVLFTKHGHTPVVIGARATPLDPLSPKHIADKLWIGVGTGLTMLMGVRSVELKKLRENAHVFTYHKLERSVMNPFLTKVHPYFVCLKLR